MTPLSPIGTSVICLGAPASIARAVAFAGNLSRAVVAEMLEIIGLPGWTRVITLKRRFRYECGERGKVDLTIVWGNR
jgi:hypothetical protein